jgi:hypothetical protein
VPGGLTLLMFAADVSVNAPLGAVYGSARQALSQEIEADVHDGMSPGSFVLKYAGRIHPQPARLYILLRKMAHLKLPPFDDVPEVTRQLYSWTMVNLPPVRIESERSPVQRRLDGDWEVLFVPAGCALHFDVPLDLERVHIAWGMPQGEVARGRTPGMRLVVACATQDGQERRIVYERTIDPVRVPGDRGGLAADVTIPPSEHHVVIELLTPEGNSPRNDWGFLGDVSFQ